MSENWQTNWKCDFTELMMILWPKYFLLTHFSHLFWWHNIYFNISWSLFRFLSFIVCTFLFLSSIHVWYTDVLISLIPSGTYTDGEGHNLLTCPSTAVIDTSWVMEITRRHRVCGGNEPCRLDSRSEKKWQQTVPRPILFLVCVVMK